MRRRTPKGDSYSACDTFGGCLGTWSVFIICVPTREGESPRSTYVLGTCGPYLGCGRKWCLVENSEMTSTAAKLFFSTVGRFRPLLDPRTPHPSYPVERSVTDELSLAGSTRSPAVAQTDSGPGAVLGGLGVVQRYLPSALQHEMPV